MSSLFSDTRRAWRRPVRPNHAQYEARHRIVYVLLRAASRRSSVDNTTNRTTQRWTIKLTENGEVTITGNAVFAKRCDTWSSTEPNFPNIRQPAKALLIESAGAAPLLN
jgi:hypothetical protein